MPEALAEEPEVNGLDDYPLGMAMATVGFMAVFFIERVLFKHKHDSPVPPTPIPNSNCSKAALLNPKASVDNVQDLEQANQDLGTKVGTHVADSAKAVGVHPEPEPKNSILACMSSVQEGLLLLVAFCAHGVLEGIIIGLQVGRIGLLPIFAPILCRYWQDNQ